MPAQLPVRQLTAHGWRLGLRVDTMKRLIRDGPNPRRVPSPVDCSVQDFFEIPEQHDRPTGKQRFRTEAWPSGERKFGSVPRISVVGASRPSKSG